jgi:ABC-type Zn uptake system ZnuABC Zn-binding protein ZnuA
MPSRQIARRPILPLGCAIAALGLAVAGCGDDDSGSSAEVSVSASTTQLADIASNVAGERADVTGILPPNADPHDYEPRPSDAESIGGADLILQSGGDLDLWLDELVESAESDAPVVTMLDFVQTIAGGHAHEEHAGEEEIDPHWWQDPANAVIAAETIRDELIEIDPGGREDYEANAADYIEGIEDLDAQIEECMSEIPAEDRKLVTTHDALGYFADRYNIEVVGSVLPALTTQAQPSAGETQELVDLITEEGVNAVFPEAGVNAALEETVAEETGAEIGDELWADTLGPDGSSGETYLEATAHNANALADGFAAGQGACDVSA